MRTLKFFIFILISYTVLSQEMTPVNSVSKNFYPTYAFTNAHIIIDYENQIDNGTLIIKKDKIIDVGENIEIPKGAIIINLDGGYIYPSFIDLYSSYGIKKSIKKKTSMYPQFDSNKEGAYHWNEAVHPEINACDQFSINNEQIKNYLSSGFGVVLTHQQDGIVRGTASLVSLSQEKESNVILNPKSALAFSFKKGSSSQNYPSSLMGSIALIKQFFLDANWYKNQKDIINLSYISYNANINLPHIFETNDVLDYSRINEIANEFELDFIIKGNGEEYEYVNDINTFGFPIILPINFPKKYNVSNPELNRALTLSKLKQWETAPFNPRILYENGIEFCITMEGIQRSEEFLNNLKIAINKGLPKKIAIKSLTYTPATIINQEETIVSIEKNKKANFLICSGDIFDNGKIYENWTNGKRHIINKKPINDFRGYYTFRSKINEIRNFKLSGSVDEIKVQEFTSDTSLVTYKTDLQNNTLLFSNYDMSFRGISEYVDGVFIGFYENDFGEMIDFELQFDSTLIKNKKESEKFIDTIIPNILSPNKAYGTQLKKEKLSILFTNATIWTNEESGILDNANVAIKDGKIIAVGKKIDGKTIFKNNDFSTIDLKGKHLTCGIVDEHSHIAISKGVNESSQAITAEVSIANVINPKDHNIYRQLAGGVTTAQLLHGSANPIGGQSAIIKFRWGSNAEDMKIKNAKGFIKLALGENVKQSNWGDNNTIRFPQTRMGVEQVFYDAFLRAKEYKKEWDTYNNLRPHVKRNTSPPREDLALNALVEILNSERFVTCHSYIQSEINMLMHVADSMGFTINTFTHILEGYKVAKKMKIHGAGASTFSDWWAYKFEVNDAIPYNAAILNENGIVTAINSDDAEMGRRLNHEAAKAIKYGNVSEVEAWKMITLNPAILLHLDNQIGSIAKGKDADIVIWSSNPLSVYAKVEQTYVDGILMYCIQESKQLEERDLRERLRLIKKMGKDISNNNFKEIELENEKIYHCETIEDYE